MLDRVKAILSGALDEAHRLERWHSWTMGKGHNCPFTDCLMSSSQSHKRDVGGNQSRVIIQHGKDATRSKSTLGAVLVPVEVASIRVVDESLV